MGSANLFEITLVITAFMLITSSCFGIAAPSFGVTVPSAPVFPVLADLGVNGNFSDTYAFVETKTVGAYDVQFPAFVPDKNVKFDYDFFDSSIQFFKIQRSGSILVTNIWYDEPIFYANGTTINQGTQTSWLYNALNEKTLTPQTIVDNYKAGQSLFIVDKGTNYECYAAFSPLPGYSTMLSSWNEAKGFTLKLYGNSYEAPNWVDQVAAYLTWFGNIIAYLVYFIAYIIQIASVLFVTLGLMPQLAAGVVILIIIAFIGSLLMFLRGNGGGK